jgi:hypothetical protein
VGACLVAVTITTPDSREWRVFTIGSVTRPDESIIMAVCDAEGLHRVTISDQRLSDIPPEVLAEMVMRADALSPDVFDQWRIRPRTQTIQPPAKSFVPGSGPLTGKGTVSLGATVIVKLRHSGQRVSVKVNDLYGAQVYSGVVADVEDGAVPPSSLIGRTISFHENHVFVVEADPT